ncbi:MAG: hypothetical protein ACE5OO_01565 [Candidatus Bathyarchaeia archaeon]
MRETDQSLVFLEFEYIFTICVILVLALMYLFYVRYPYDKEREPPREIERRVRGHPKGEGKA